MFSLHVGVRILHVSIYSITFKKYSDVMNIVCMIMYPKNHRDVHVLLYSLNSKVFSKYQIVANLHNIGVTPLKCKVNFPGVFLLLKLCDSQCNTCFKGNTCKFTPEASKLMAFKCIKTIL